jgi:upstream activation factor subunit UAF30
MATSNEKTAKKSAAKKSTKGDGSASGRAKGISAPVTPDAQLAKIVGTAPLPRTELTKKIWDYIKSKNLQDQTNRRMINADENLRPIFGKEQVSMFEMTKLVSQHVK